MDERKHNFMKNLRVLIFSFVIIILLTNYLSAQENINWIYDYDEGIKKAYEEKKTLLIVLTAPSWCGPCQIMEKYAFQDKETIKYINENLIAIKLLDTNPDINRIDFGGYPTFIFADYKNNEYFREVGNIHTSLFLSYLKKAVNYDEFLENLDKEFEASKNDGEKITDYIYKRFYYGQYDILKQIEIVLNFAIKSTSKATNL